MRHSRPDYERFQDPAGHPDLHIYDFLRQLADAYEADRSGQNEGTEVVALVEAFLGTGSAIAPRLATVRAFAARAEIPRGSTPVGADEPVFLIRGQDVTAADAVEAYARIADARGGNRVAVAARRWALEMRRWQEEHGSKVPDLPAEDGR